MILDNKVALVTGASKGIGASSALVLAQNGAKVAVNYNSSIQKANELVDTINSFSKAIAIKANVFVENESKSLVAQAVNEFGPIDILVLNAGPNFKMAPFTEQTWEDFETKILKELKACYWTLQAVVPSMISRKTGSIIIISSSSSRRSSPGFSTHTTAKSALDGLAKALALELGPHGIRVNVVAPGLTETDATELLPSEVKNMIASHTPLRRNALPDDIAGAVLFYASDLSKFISGNYTPVNGGNLML